MKTITTIALCLAISLAGWSQNIKTPQPSPGASVQQDFGLGSVTIDYSRPGVKGRTIYGDLVPYGKLWRTGANMATTIEFTDDVTIEGKELKAGKYAILSIPNETEWTIIFSKNSKVFTSDYKEEEDALRVQVKPNSYKEKVESFTINFTDVKDGELNVQLLWENTSVVFNVKTDVDAVVMKTITETMAGTSSRDYYLAAKYYYTQDKDISVALGWINTAVEMDSEKPKFWVVHWQAKILAKSGDSKGAVKAAELSKKLAVEAKYDSYIKKNDDLLKELNAK